MKKLIKRLNTVLAFLSAGLGLLHEYRVRSTGGSILSGPKLLAGAISPFAAALGALSAALGALSGSLPATLAGLLGAGLSARYVQRVLKPQGELARAFGPGWEDRIPEERKRYMLAQRWQGRLPEVPDPRWERDVVFHELPDGRELLCDVWQPPEGIAPSGLALVYLHGSGWHFLDKDVGTRPLFRHLAAQGHVIVDVAYRLCPEADWRGMLADAKHAVAWTKAQAERYGFDPERVVLAGGSAGGHLALLAAYTAGDAALTPEDLQGADLAVRGVVSWYGPTDMRVYYEHAGVTFGTLVEEEKETVSKLEDRIMEAMGFEMKTPEHWPAGVTIQEAMMRALFGCTPEENPEEYRLGSPVTHVDPGCPPTLLLQGEYDAITSAEAVRALAEKLRAASVPVAHVEYPQTEHAFDLILPQVSPSAQAALYKTERFLALLNVCT